MIETVAIVAAIAPILSKLNFAIRKKSPDESARDCDIVATAPDGRTFVLEVKTGSGPAHFASIAEVDRYAKQLGRAEGQEVTPILITTQEVSPRIADVAESVGVEVLEVPDSVDDIAASVQQRFESNSEPRN